MNNNDLNKQVKSIKRLSILIIFFILINFLFFLSSSLMKDKEIISNNIKIQKYEMILEKNGMSDELLR